MKSVETVKNAENINNNLFKDFYTVPNLKFDVEKLRSDLDKILKLKNFNSLGIKNPTNKLFEKSGEGNIKKPAINPIIIEK